MKTTLTAVTLTILLSGLTATAQARTTGEDFDELAQQRHQRQQYEQNVCYGTWPDYDNRRPVCNDDKTNDNDNDKG